MVAVWNTSRVMKCSEVTLIAKAHTDVDIAGIKMSPADDIRLVFSKSSVKVIFSSDFSCLYSWANIKVPATYSTLVHLLYVHCV